MKRIIILSNKSGYRIWWTACRLTDGNTPIVENHRTPVEAAMELAIEAHTDPLTRDENSISDRPHNQERKQMLKSIL